MNLHTSGDHLGAQTIVSRETRERLALLVSLVSRWNRTIRLVAQADRVELWSRHVCDCLQLTRLVGDEAGQAADVGSGAGFPGLVLSISLDRHFYLIESDRRKAAFLAEAARLTCAKATVLPSRAQAVKIQCRLVTARAFASVDRTLDAVFDMLAPDAVCLLPKGRSVEAELLAAALHWRMRVQRYPSVTDPEATILYVSEISRA